MSIFYRIYLWIASLISRSSFLHFVGVAPERIEAFQNPTWKSTPSAAVHSVHFHAASAGELEILIPMIHAYADRHQRLVLTFFSPSTQRSMHRLVDALIAKNAKLVYVGFSPVEDEWENFLKRFSVRKSIVSKYEAWPGLWAALSQLDIPLIIVQAQMRSSLVWVERALRWFGIKAPRLWFYGSNEARLIPLKKIFHKAYFKEVPDPRWVQIHSRAQAPAPRVQQLLEMHKELPKPFGVLGSVWQEDLTVLIPALTQFKGTLWVVPHSLDAKHVEAMKQQLAPIAKKAVLVAEMGFLLELYSIADWAWVGGGFGKGVHSTMEPAYFEIPVACGPKNAEKFPEIEELVSQGGLTVCHSRSEFETFLKNNALKGNQASQATQMRAKVESFPSWVEETLLIR